MNLKTKIKMTILQNKDASLPYQIVHHNRQIFRFLQNQIKITTLVKLILKERRVKRLKQSWTIEDSYIKNIIILI